MTVPPHPFLATALFLSVSACASGVPLQGQAPPSFEAHTLGTQAGCWLLACVAASSTQITSDRAVTAAHARYAVSWSAHDLQQADLAWFPSSGSAPLVRDPQDGETVTLYGNSLGFGARQATGHVLLAHVGICRSRIPDPSDKHGAALWCSKQGLGVDYGMAIDADGGSGFSGGGVYGADGDLLGVVTDTMDIGGRPAMFAYWASEIHKEIAP